MYSPKYLIKFSTILTILIFGITSAITAQDTSFEDWDEDGDELIERHEFVDKFVDEYFQAWDPENEMGLIEEGFFRESFAGLDTDNDNFLSDEEWLIGYNYFYEDYIVYDDMAAIDSDGDGQVDYQEYYDALYESAYFTDIDLDADNYISEFELANYVFENWDTNDSGLINRSEFKQFDEYYLDV
ncbi:hypothetical protein ACKGJO_08865 [Gracilimonas sp. Q87]|uniref:hypothetical protein n=1 Tax=Gracilimonas sp. Q87 TaxID=3384766 RepID=UPI003983FE35